MQFEADLQLIHEDLREHVDVDMDDSVVEEEEDLNADTCSELTFARMTNLADDDVPSLTNNSERKRKAQEQDELARRSEIRLLGNTSRLDRIPERRSSIGIRSLPPRGEIEDVESSHKFPRASIAVVQSGFRSVPRTRSYARKESDEDTASSNSPGVERSLSRLSITKHSRKDDRDDRLTF